MLLGLRQAGALERGQCPGAHPPQQPGAGGPHQGVDTVAGVGFGLPPVPPGCERCRVGQLGAVAGERNLPRVEGPHADAGAAATVPSP
jgi:hypothetical protein